MMEEIDFFGFKIGGSKDNGLAIVTTKEYQLKLESILQKFNISGKIKEAKIDWNQKLLVVITREDEKTQ